MDKMTRNPVATLLALALVATGCASTAAPSAGGARTDARSAAVTHDMATPEQGESPIALDRDPYERRAPPNICYRGWLAPAIAFEPGSSKLVPCAIRVLDESITAMRRHPDTRVEVAGHSDSTESGIDSKALSLRRAQVVYNYLIAHGVPASMLIGPVGYGAERLLEVDTGPEGTIVDQNAAKSNRRVELNAQN